MLDIEGAAMGRAPLVGVVLAAAFFAVVARVLTKEATRSGSGTTPFGAGS